MENRYNAVSKELVEELKKVVGKENVHTDPGTLDRYKTDEEQDARLFHLPEAVVAPGSTEEVAAIMNHERTSWGNNAKKVTPDDVKKVLEAIKSEKK